MPLTRRERLGASLVLAGLLALVGLRPALRVGLREVGPELAVRVQALRDELDPWGRPFVAPGLTTIPGSGVTIRWTGPTYSTGPDGVDDTAARRSHAELWFEGSRHSRPYPSLSVDRMEVLPGQPFDDRRNDEPAPAWDGHFRPLLAGDDVLVAWGSTPLVRLLVGPFEVGLGLLCLAAGWVLLLLEEGAPRREARRTADRLRRLGVAAGPVALAGWVGVELAEAPEVRSLLGAHPLVPAPVALGGSAAFAALLIAAGLLARRRDEPGPASP